MPPGDGLIRLGWAVMRLGEAVIPSGRPVIWLGRPLIRPRWALIWFGWALICAPSAFPDGFYVVLADWGPTGREIAAQVVAAKKYEQEHPLTEAPMANTNAIASTKPALPSAVATGSIAQPSPLPGISVQHPTIAIGPRGGASIGLTLPSEPSTGLGLWNNIGTPSRLGGPKAEIAIGDLTNSGHKTDFLRAAHDSACRIFGTVLGPEANAAHRNHFHLDMAARTIKSICE